MGLKQCRTVPQSAGMGEPSPLPYLESRLQLNIVNDLNEKHGGRDQI
jgi:hypothetical protein